MARNDNPGKGRTGLRSDSRSRTAPRIGRKTIQAALAPNAR